MGKIHINIKRINLRNRGLSEPSARSISQGLGQELLRGLDQNRHRFTPGSINLSDAHVGTIKVNPSEVRTGQQCVGQATTKAIMAQSSKMGSRP